MNKELILLIFVIILVLYLVIKSLIFWKKFKINPAAFVKGENLKEILTWWTLTSLLILFGIEIVLFYFGKINIMFNNKYLNIIGFIILFLGFLTMVIAHAQMGQSWRMGLDKKTKTKLISNGIFGISRNPVYLGLIIQGIAILMLLPDIFTLVLFLLLIIDLYIVIRQEEEFLKKEFGKEYLYYKTRVRRFI